MTPQQRYTIERTIETAPTMYECRQCHKVWPYGIQPCGCDKGARVVDPAKVWRKVRKELER